MKLLCSQATLELMIPSLSLSSTEVTGLCLHIKLPLIFLHIADDSCSSGVLGGPAVS